MSRYELAERIESLESANRRFRRLATLLGLALVVLVAAGWVGPGWGSGEAKGAAAAEAPRELRARSLVLVDDSGQPAARMETTDGALQISMLRSGEPVGASRPAPGDSTRGASVGEVPGTGSSLVLYPSPSPGVVLYGPHGRKVVRLGEVEAVRLR